MNICFIRIEVNFAEALEAGAFSFLFLSNFGVAELKFRKQISSG